MPYNWNHTNINFLIYVCIYICICDYMCMYFVYRFNVDLCLFIAHLLVLLNTTPLYGDNSLFIHFLLKDILVALNFGNFK